MNSPSPSYSLRLLAAFVTAHVPALPPRQRIRYYLALADILPTDSERRAAREVAKALSRSEALQLDFSQHLTQTRQPKPMPSHPSHLASPPTSCVAPSPLASPKPVSSQRSAARNQNFQGTQTFQSAGSQLLRPANPAPHVPSAPSLPLVRCAYCHRIRLDRIWVHESPSPLAPPPAPPVTHGCCPDCAKKQLALHRATRPHSESSENANLKSKSSEISNLESEIPAAQGLEISKLDVGSSKLNIKNSPPGSPAPLRIPPFPPAK